MRYQVILLIIILCSITAHATSIDNIKEQLDTASDEVSDFFSGIDMDNITIVFGSKISLEDRILFNLIKSQSPKIQGKEIEPDTSAQLDKNIVLIGGEKTNLLSRSIISEEKINTIETKTFSPLILKQGLLNNGNKYMIAYSEKEINNNQNSAILKSPLAKIMNPMFVPFAAVSLSLLMLYLWNIFGKTIANLLSDFLSSKILNKKSSGKTIKKKKVHEIKPHEFINLSEVATFIITVIIFALTMSWTWSNDPSDFWKIFLLNLMVVGIISFIREFTRLVFCYKQKLRSEFVLWPIGTIITLISTFLGNTFSLASYTLLDEDEADIKKFGKSSFLIALMTFIIGIITYLINIVRPSLILQMSFIYCMMILVIEMFPISPMPGIDVKKWKMPVWLISYIVISIAYIFVNFTIYV